MVIEIKYHDDVCRIEKIAVGDWIDLKCRYDYDFEPGDFKLVDLGVSMRVPEGYETIVAPRSSTFKRYGLLQANGIGIIDNSFNSDLDVFQFPAYATRSTHLDAGTRICQFRVQKSQPEVELVEVDTLGADKRGGFGSTGI
jgi:dUTP pyrophosphatase